MDLPLSVLTNMAIDILVYYEAISRLMKAHASFWQEVGN